MNTRRASSDTQPATIEGSVYYAAAGRQPLFAYANTVPAGEAETNVEFVEHTVAIRDMRGSGSEPRLDVEGAALVRQRSAVRDFYDEDELRRAGYAEAGDILRTLTGAQQVVVFDHNVRRGADASDPKHAYARKPVFHVHTDFTAGSAPIRAQTLLSPEAIAGRRMMQLNLWRPITEPVLDNALALCDASSVRPGDLLPTALRYPERQGEIYYVKFNPAHRWWYASEMRRDEVWVFKNYDSAADGRARFTPHTAFQTSSASLPRRESVEFRAFAVFDD
ncbi:MAG TPA: CmcJ/NvfI family oxidoreductase [Steroidobacteraceae bacterium]|nr:CmcJ/NvfI family oxidoreductase [Steroidobacteraceae bacterium]